MIWLNGFASRACEVNGAPIHARLFSMTPGEPPRPALLLHGCAQTRRFAGQPAAQRPGHGPVRPQTGHFILEAQPEATARTLRAFFTE